MDFATLPPEVTSSWMYSGPGPRSMLVAAAAWDQLAAELGSAASNYRAVISELITSSWQGPAASAMGTAAAPYAEWLTATSEQARQVANQARSAAAAYQAALAATVPPPVIAANRAQLQSLMATNIVGQNAVAIAANQAQYGEMWAKNATAMYTYAGNSAAATTLSSFADPPQVTNPAGQTNQARAVSQATTTGATLVPKLLQSVTSGNPVVNFLEQVNTFLETNPLYVAAGSPLETAGGVITDAGAPLFMEISPIFYLTSSIFTWFPALAGGTTMPFTISDVSGTPINSTLVSSSGLAAGLDGDGAAPALLRGGVSAGLGRATAVAGLSVPQTWGVASGIKPVSASSPLVIAPAGLGGFHGAIPPIASVVNAPRNGASAGARAGARGNPTSKSDGAARAAGVGGESIPDTVNPLTDKEREELVGLRAQLVKLVMKQDAVARLMNQAFQP